jgi:FkbM family methyltransferase
VRKAWWLVKYFGFNVLLSIFTHEPHEPIIIKCSNDKVSVTPHLLRWLLHAMDLNCIKHSVFCKNGSIYVVDKDGEVHSMSYNNAYVIDNAKFVDVYTIMIEIFFNGVYKPLTPTPIVVDVGAYIGDSAIYFALKGAKRVIAIEPHPGAFAEMLDNVKLNNMESVIIPVNAGLASRPGKICIENTNTYDTKYVYHRPGDCPNAVPAVTLGELISRFGINTNEAVLKMDCEGCEYDVILNDYEHVRLFRELIFEYHPRFVNKSLDDLLNVLGRDYKCEIKGDNNQGIMHCVRK